MSKSSHNHGLSGARIALIVAASVATAGAKDVRTDFSVSATVLAVANLELQSAPMDLQISAADVRRGFIDVAQPTQVVVRSNSQRGFALEVLTVAPMLSSMVVQGLDSDLVAWRGRRHHRAALAEAAGGHAEFEISIYPRAGP